MDSLIEKYDLFIFDLDDTLVKTEKYHYEAWLKTLKEIVGKDFYIDYNFFCSKFHSMIENSIKIYLENDLNLYNYTEIIEYKNNYYMNIIKENKSYITLVDGAESFINKICY